MSTPPPGASAVSRRTVLAGTSATIACFSSETNAQPLRSQRIAIIVDPTDTTASSAPASWALDQLQSAVAAAGFAVRRYDRVEDAPADVICVLAQSCGGAAESLELSPIVVGGRAGIVARGADGRGLSYALSELADRVRFAPKAGLMLDQAISQRPQTPVRSVMRQFTSEAYDKPWFYDREGWSAYLDMLAGHRFNRVHLAFGQAYDNLRRVEDSYFLFPYPFFVAVPGYDVRVADLPAEERTRNLDTLRFISEQAVARGLEFQLGLWMHGYEYGPQSQAKHRIEGLSPQTHAGYCRDALAELLRACPAISALSIRTHGESGVPEGSYEFWKVVFDGVRRAGRPVELDLHAKGVDARMIDLAHSTGMPVNVSAKYSAEHMALPFQQASIRELERPKAGLRGEGLMTLSEGELVHTRAGYADFLREDRKYTVRFRVYPGTQRILLWGDPVFASGYSRAFTFSGCTGGDVMEPLTYRGRRGTSSEARRTGYRDARLEPRWDWQKYAYWYRVWGRKLYDPETPAEVFDREFGSEGPDPALAASLAAASRILPTVTSAYLPSVACSVYWPEMYWNQPLTAEPVQPLYNDTPSPKVFAHASAADPQLFANCAEFAAELLAGERSGKYSPAEVAVWLESFAEEAQRELARSGKASSVADLRTQIDVEIQTGLGRFFAGKLRGGALYALYERSGDRRALDACIRQERAARAVWTDIVGRTRGIYAEDLSVSDWVTERGGWRDRLAPLDEDIAALERQLAEAKADKHPRVPGAIAAVLAPGRRANPPARHTPPRGFAAGQALPVELALSGGASVTLYYRRLNQAENYRSTPMTRHGAIHRAMIPATYTESPFPVQYYFEVTSGAESATLYPGISADFTAQPYFLVRQL